MSDPTKVSTEANRSDANSAAGDAADGRLSDGELNLVNGGWGYVSMGPRPTAAAKERQAGLSELMAEQHKN